MKDSYGTYDGRKSEPPYIVERDAAFQHSLEMSVKHGGEHISEQEFNAHYDAAERDRLRAVNAELVEALRHILGLADENAKGIDGYEQIAQWASMAIDKATGQHLSRAEVLSALARLGIK